VSGAAGLTEERRHPRGEVRVSGAFPSPAAAEAAREAYYRAYPPEGYGTALTLREDARQGRSGGDVAVWLVEGSRAASCD
jgi:hypothetical protein